MTRGQIALRLMGTTQGATIAITRRMRHGTCDASEASNTGSRTAGIVFPTPPPVAAVRRTLHGLVLRGGGHEINHGSNRLPVCGPPLSPGIPQENGEARGQREARHGDVRTLRSDDHGLLRAGNENNVVSVAAVIAEQFY